MNKMLISRNLNDKLNDLLFAYQKLKFGLILNSCDENEVEEEINVFLTSFLMETKLKDFYVNIILLIDYVANRKDLHKAKQILIKFKVISF